MNPKDLTTLKAALKILKKGHKPCKTFSLGCAGCYHTLLLDLLYQEIKIQEWSNKKK